ncbi:putative RiPP precursor [Mesorhizobium sp. ZMM04-5]|uniref:RiPP n=1 Tax=Mesorhizobium marinum TaxID=3228790 RepID=A0ABV3QVK9_9HYPH
MTKTSEKKAYEKPTLIARDRLSKVTATAQSGGIVTVP